MKRFFFHSNYRAVLAALVIVGLSLTYWMQIFKGETWTDERKEFVHKADLPRWVEVFDLPYKRFQPQNIPIVIFSSYRDSYLARSVESLRIQANDISPTTTCIFVLHRTSFTEQERIDKTMYVIQNIKFCNVLVWRYDTEDKSTASVYKNLWWSVIKRVFNGENSKIFQGPNTGDVFFLEEDAVLSPDAIKVLWFCCRVKNTFGPDIWQVALGGHAGKNMINPHPDTVNIRKTTFFQAMAYAFNSSLWKFITKYENFILHSSQIDDFSEVIAYVFADPKLKTTLNVVAPTLARMWHIGKKGLGLSGDSSLERDTETKPNWEKLTACSRIDIEKAEVNYGIRDQYGSLCEPAQRYKWKTFNDNLCKNSYDRYSWMYYYHGHAWLWYKVLCWKQPYVSDKCI